MCQNHKQEQVRYIINCMQFFTREKCNINVAGPNGNMIATIYKDVKVDQTWGRKNYYHPP